MLLSTINYNQPELTDSMVEIFKLDSHFNQHELMVLDNGSTKTKAQSTTHITQENLFFGGGVNTVLDYFLSTNHKYCAIFNNDLKFHGPNLTKNIIQDMEENDLALYSPSITNTGADQCYWRQMWNWGTHSVRKVLFIDFMCAVFRRDLVEKIKQFPKELGLGWGLDFYSGIICKHHNLNVGVSDKINLSHLVGSTFKSKSIDIPESSFSMQADHNMHTYFLNSEYKSDFLNFREVCSKYSA